MKSELSICVINYNTPGLTKRCLDSLEQLRGKIDLEVVVFDNSIIPANSFTPSSLRPWFKFKYHKSLTNKYFSGGFNSAFELTSSDYVLILNNDCFFIDDSLLKMLKFMKSNPAAGACEGIIVDERSQQVTSTSSRELTRFRDFVRSNRIARILCRPMLDYYMYSGWDRTTSREVEVICDAFVMVRSDAFRKVGGFEESLKLYFTEEYLSDKLREFGYKLFHFGESSVVHSWQSSTSLEGRERIKVIYETDKKNYFSLKR